MAEGRRSPATSFVSLASLLLAAAAPLCADTYPRQPGVDVLDYSFRLALRDDTDVLEGETTVAFRVASDGLATLALDLVQPKAESPERGMAVSTVATPAGAPLRFEHAADRLTVFLDPPGRAGERRSVVVRYSGVPATGLLIAGNKHGERTFFSDNWPIKARHWLPTIDHPYDKATSEMTVTAPSHYQVVSNGLLVEETDTGDGRRVSRWRQSVPIAAWLNVLGVARFAVDHRPAWRGLPIETWVYRQDRDKGFARFAEPTAGVLDFLADRVGPYAYERLGNVQANGVRGGMESATSIFYGDDAVDDPGSVRWRNVIVHEIAHQWFGNAVTESDWDDVWLSEGFATYFTQLFVEHAYGRAEADAMRRASRDTIREFYDKNPDYRVVHDQLSDMTKVLSGPGTYQKGAWTLHMLRGLVGDAAFWTGIRSYYRDHRNGNASTADFRHVMEDASGQDLGWFFDQWLTRGGFLRLRGRWSYDARAKQLRLDVEQLQPGPPFRVPLDVAIAVEGDEEPRHHRVETRSGRESLAIPLDAAPRTVTLDPYAYVLMDADVARAPAGR
jgi:aminopeptidase N